MSRAWDLAQSAGGWQPKQGPESRATPAQREAPAASSPLRTTIDDLREFHASPPASGQRADGPNGGRLGWPGNSGGDRQLRPVPSAPNDGPECLAQGWYAGCPLLAFGSGQRVLIFRREETLALAQITAPLGAVVAAIAFCGQAPSCAAPPRRRAAAPPRHRAALPPRPAAPPPRRLHGARDAGTEPAAGRHGALASGEHLAHGLPGSPAARRGAEAPRPPPFPVLTGQVSSLTPY
jgi:hypothetical protein